MSSKKLDTPVLTIDMSMIRHVDTRSVESLHGIWIIFSRCAASLQEGRRLENLSWRLWNRETLCCDANNVDDQPQLASNITPSPSCDAERSIPTPSRKPSFRSTRGRERHITPDDLERMVMTIKERKDLQPLSHSPSSTMNSPSRTSVNVNSTILRSVGGAKIEITDSNTVLDLSSEMLPCRPVPLPPTSPATETSDVAHSLTTEDSKKKKKTVFALGGSSGDDSCEHLPPVSSVRETLQQTRKKSAMFSFGGSSNEEESAIPRKMEEVLSANPPTRHQTSFQEDVSRRSANEEALDGNVFESDEEDIDESAIDDDDDSSDWEDSVEGSGNASADDKNLFQRVDSRVNLTSRRSLITTMLHQHERRDALAHAAMNSKSETSLRPERSMGPGAAMIDLAMEPQPHESMMNLGSLSEIPRSAAQPIARTDHHFQNLALSPRTTRRNMLASELTVSLRQHLLWERKQKTQNVSSGLKRRHTSQDFEHLKQYPETSYTGPDEAQGSWDEYFAGGMGEYNSRGW